MQTHRCVIYWMLTAQSQGAEVFWPLCERMKRRRGETGRSFWHLVWQCSRSSLNSHIATSSIQAFILLPAFVVLMHLLSCKFLCFQHYPVWSSPNITVDSLQRVSQKLHMVAYASHLSILRWRWKQEVLLPQPHPSLRSSWAEPLELSISDASGAFPVPL